MTTESRQPIRIGYCTNVHAGATLDAMQRELEMHATRVREIICPQGVLEIGLWLSAPAAEELLAGDGIARFRDWLDERGLRVFTMNGFPFGNFHGAVVKHRVYEPSWAEPNRATYTMNLARILAGLLDAGERASISTLPIGWPGPPCKAVDLNLAAVQLNRIAAALREVHEETGRFITIDLEPEPGCLLDTAEKTIDWFTNHLTGDTCRKHLGVCHDICHAAVMFEDQTTMFTRYRNAGMMVNKIQVSNAPCAHLAAFSDVERLEMFAALREFEEPRYLHQTSVRENGRTILYEDLPIARAHHESLDRLGDEWRVHFHVPIYLEWLGRIGTTRATIHECLRAMQILPNQPVLEIETYAWDVLSAEHRGDTLAEDIARELVWLREQFSRESDAAP